MKNINEKKWNSFKINDIFEIVQRGKRLKKEDQISGNIPYVSSKAITNGVDGTCGNTKETRIYNNCITLANSGSVGSCFYHPYEFIASDHVTALSKSNISKDCYLGLSVLIKQLRQKFGFNREISDARLKNEIIMLPVNESGEPDYDFLDHYISAKRNEKSSEYIKFLKQRLTELGDIVDIPTLKEKQWKNFKISEFFVTLKDKNGNSKSVPTGASIKSFLLEKGTIPRITATSLNNGISSFTNEVDNKNFKTSENFISMSFLGTAKYHPYKASLDMKIHSLQLNDHVMNQYLGLFITTMLNCGFHLFTSYGNQLSSKDLVNKFIYLPINDLGEPDYEYMEQYIKNIMIKKYNQYLEFLNK